MAHIRCDFRANALEMNTSMTVVLPEGVELSTVPVLYVFHGLEDNCTGWARYTSIERYARAYNAAVIIPEVQRSYYTDMDCGMKYFTFIHDELPQTCHRLFGLSLKKEQNYVMGLSMGGYGALKCMLQTPERYAGCAAFSAVTDLPDWIENAAAGRKKEWISIFGPEMKVPEDSELFSLLEKRDGSELPKVYMACGEGDALYPMNERFAGKLQEKAEPFRFEHWEGIHNWDFWDPASKKAVDFLLGNK